VREPWQFFWAKGALSSFLDNAPTYLTFLALAQGQGLAPEVVGVPHEILRAISLGAVFMGANTYIGNGPNFMVRAIAEEPGGQDAELRRLHGGERGGVLLPLFALVTLVFFRYRTKDSRREASESGMRYFCGSRAILQCASRSSASPA